MEVLDFRVLKGLFPRGGREREQRCVRHFLRASPSNLTQAGYPDGTGTSESLGPQKNRDLSLTADLATMPERGAARACTAARADHKAGTDPPPALPSSLGGQGTQGSTEAAILLRLPSSISAEEQEEDLGFCSLVPPYKQCLSVALTFEVVVL